MPKQKPAGDSSLKKLGQYEILGEIGRGNMGVVYKAEHSMLKNFVAIKTMSSKLGSNPTLRTRFFREAQAVAQLSHKNIVLVKDMGKEGDEVYLVMEFLEGQDLKTIIEDINEKRRQPLSLEAELKIFLQICDGLEHAHSKNVIHRDIKPGNIFINNSGDVKILDFGLARLADSELTGTNDQMGTPAYMSPEQVGSSKVDLRTDIYSTGVVFYEVLTHTRAFYGDSLPAIFFKIINTDPEPIETINPLIPRELSAIVHKAMAKNAAQRYQTMADMRADLENFQQLLETQKRVTHTEAKEAFSKLDKLILDNKDLLKEAAEKLQEIKANSPTLFAQLGAAGGEGTASRTPGLLGYFEVVELCERAKREYNRLSGLAETRKRAIASVDEALRLEEKGELGNALKIVDALLKDDPSFVNAQDARKEISARIEEQKLEEEREQKVAANFKEAEAKFARGDLAGCLTSLADVLRLRPEHAAAAKLLEQAQRNLSLQAELKEKQRQFGRKLAEARKALAEENFEEARKAAFDASSILPESPDPAILIDEISQKEEEFRKKREREEQIGKLLAEIHSFKSAGNESEALERLNAILELDPGHPVAAVLKGEIEESQNARAAIAKLFAEAELKFLSNDLAGCIPLLAETLKLQPAHKEALDLFERAKRKIREQEELEEEHRRALDALIRAKRAISADDLDSARKCLDQAREICQSTRGVADLLAQLEQGEALYLRNLERLRKINEIMGRAREYRQAGDYETALATLDKIQEIAPGYPAARELAASIRQFKEDRERAERERLRKIEEYFNDALSAEKTGDLEQAARLVQLIQSEDAGHAKARELQARIETQLIERSRAEEKKRDRIQLLLNQARAAKLEKRYDQALQALDEILSLGDTRKEVVDLKEAVGTEYNAEKLKRARAAEGERQRELGLQHLAEKRYQQSLAALKRARELLGEDFFLASKIAEAEDGLRREERLARILTLVTRCRQALTNEEFNQAAEYGAEILTLDPLNDEAKDLIKKIESAQEHKHRRLEIATLLAQGHQALVAEDFQQSAKFASEVLLLDPQNSVAFDLLKKSEFNQQEKHKHEIVTSLLVRGQQAFKRLELEEAATRIQELMRLDPENPEAKGLLKEIERAQEKKSRQGQISELLISAQKLYRESHLIASAQAAREILKLDAGNKEARSLLKKIEKEQKIEEKQTQSLRKTQGFSWQKKNAVRFAIIAVITVAAGLSGWKMAIPYFQELSIEREFEKQFRQEKYEDAAMTIARWLAEHPDSKKAIQLKEKNQKALAALHGYRTALTNKDYLGTNKAIARLCEAIVDVDPMIDVDATTEKYRDRMRKEFNAVFRNQFLVLEDLSEWNAPAGWQTNKGKLIVRNGLGTIRTRFYDDFEAIFNVEFVEGDTAAWVLRLQNDTNYYLFQLTGAGGNPPDAFVGYKVVEGKTSVIVPTTPVGINLNIKGEQFKVEVKARGGKIDHSITVQGEKKDIATVTDNTFPNGTFGFNARSNCVFYAYALRIQPLDQTK
jgi:serine/threonine protein kinase